MLKRLTPAIAIASWMVALAIPARADLSYSYLEVHGVPVLDNTFKDPLGEGDVDLDGWEIGGTLSVAIHENWHLVLAADQQTQKSGNFLSLDGLGISNALKTKRTTAFFAPHFNYRVYDGDSGRPQVDVFAGLGVQFAKVRNRLEVGDQTEKDSDSEFGMLVRVGTRAMVWRDLELFGDFSGSNIGITRNELFFNLGGRYHLLDDAADVGIAIGFGTDDFVGLVLSARVYYMELWRQVFGNSSHVD